MQPIISPFWFYIAGISQSVSKTFSGIAAVFAIFDFFLGLAWMIGMDCNTDGNGGKVLRLLKTVLIWCVILFVASSLLPSRETCYQMIAAQACTPDNLQSAIDAGKSIADYIVESAIKIIESTNTAG